MFGEIGAYLLLLTVIYFAIAIFLRTLASFKFLFVIPKANMFALVTTFKNTDTKLTVGNGAGTVVNVIHGIPGKRLNKSSHDPMQWLLENGVEKRGLLYTLFGVVWIGPFRYLLKSQMRTFRISRKENETEYSDSPRDITSDFLFYSGEQLVTVVDADTAGSFDLDFRINTIWVAKYPVRVVLKVADSIAFLSTTVEDEVNLFSGSHQPEEFLGDRYTEKGASKTSSEDVKTELIDRVKGLCDQTEKEVGLSIIAARLISVDPDQAQFKFFILQGTTRRENDARLAIAENTLAIKRKQNDGEADFIERVLKPQSELPNAVGLALANAYQKNQTVTVFAPGGGLLNVIGNESLGQKPKVDDKVVSTRKPAKVPEVEIPFESK